MAHLRLREDYFLTPSHTPPSVNHPLPSIEEDELNAPRPLATLTLVGTSHFRRAQSLPLTPSRNSAYRGSFHGDRLTPTYSSTPTSMTHFDARKNTQSIDSALEHKWADIERLKIQDKRYMRKHKRAMKELSIKKEAKAAKNALRRALKIQDNEYKHSLEIKAREHEYALKRLAHADKNKNIQAVEQHTKRTGREEDGRTTKFLKWPSPTSIALALLAFILGGFRYCTQKALMSWMCKVLSSTTLCIGFIETLGGLFNTSLAVGTLGLVIVLVVSFYCVGYGRYFGKYD